MHSSNLERRLVGELEWTFSAQGGLDDVMRQRRLNENHATQIFRDLEPEQISKWLVRSRGNSEKVTCEDGRIEGWMR